MTQLKMSFLKQNPELEGLGSFGPAETLSQYIREVQRQMPVDT